MQANGTGRLAGKIAFITGAGSGIARAGARIFTREGARVVLAEIDPALGERTAAEAGAAEGKALFVRTDVTDEDSVRAAIAAGVDAFGRLDILFNCAGGSIDADKAVTEVDMSVWDHTIPLDLKGTFLCCRHGIPRLAEAGGGSIVNMTSVVALRGNHPAHVYVAAKGGIIAFTRSLAGAYAKDRIRANAIAPGLVLTDRVRRRVEGEAESRRNFKAYDTFQQYPFGVGEPEDIANIALFLASDEARMINGAVIPAEGGISAY